MSRRDRLLSAMLRCYCEANAAGWLEGRAQTHTRPTERPTVSRKAATSSANGQEPQAGKAPLSTKGQLDCAQPLTPSSMGSCNVCPINARRPSTSQSSVHCNRCGHHLAALRTQMSATNSVSAMVAEAVPSHASWHNGCACYRRVKPVIAAERTMKPSCDAARCSGCRSLGSCSIPYV